jgi:hypothetical protein
MCATWSAGFYAWSENQEAGRPEERDATKEAALMENVTDRSNRRTAPETVHPFGRYQSISEAVQDFNAVRDETLRFASEEDVNLLSRSARHRVFGPLNGVETLLLMADWMSWTASYRANAGSGGRPVIGPRSCLNAMSGRRRSAHRDIKSGRGLVPARLRARTKAGPRSRAPGRLRKDLLGDRRTREAVLCIHGVSTVASTPPQCEHVFIHATTTPLSQPRPPVRPRKSRQPPIGRRLSA